MEDASFVSGPSHPHVRPANTLFPTHMALLSSLSAPAPKPAPMFTCLAPPLPLRPQAPIAGELVKMHLDDGAPVEYQQVVAEVSPFFGGHIIGDSKYA